MFNLIVTLIAIGLGVVVTANAVFYGGDSYSEGTTEAIATTYINQAQQVQGGFTLYKAKYGADAASVDELQSSGYLSSVPVTPAGSEWALANDGTDDAIGVVSVIATSSDEGISPEVCEKVNEQGGGLVTCGSVTATATTYDDTVAATYTSGDITYDEDVTAYAAVVMSR